MAKERENMEAIFMKYEQLCRELNMDKKTEDLGREMFTEVSERFSLEGQINHWFCCVLYTASRMFCTPTVGESDSVVMGNCISLNKLLRCCNMSIYDFLSKIRKWHGMANLSPGFLKQIDKTEYTFCITLSLFQRFHDIFSELFQVSGNQIRNNKFRCSFNKCSYNKLYDMCWCLYLCVKNANSSYTLDTITSLNLLLCCIDLIYRNVLSEKRTDLLNPNYENTFKLSPHLKIDFNSFCILEHLCHLSGTMTIEARNVKKHKFNRIIQEFFKIKTLYGREYIFLEILSNDNFERNLKNLNSSYEQFILCAGELDERILLNSSSHQRNKTDKLRLEMHNEIKTAIPNTPYTRQNSLPSREHAMGFVANATYNVTRLQSISHITDVPELIKQVGGNVLEKIQEKLNGMSVIFSSKFANKADWENRFQLATSLYYYLLEKIVAVEKQLRPTKDFTNLLSNDNMHVSLIACCLEIVIDAYVYTTQFKFPWILNCFGISAFHFCKIIEIVVVRHDGILTRELIKHLNFVEEACLEHLAWRRLSPLWELIESTPGPLPTWSEVNVSNVYIKRKGSEFASKRPCETSEETNLNEYCDNSDKKNVSKRMGSLALFLRKFYKLAWLRIEKLCTELEIKDEQILDNIWTLFEYSVTKRTKLMQERSLDQILMCAIYIYIKVADIKNKTFEDIMKHYRKQPQSTSGVYRQVLIESNNSKPIYKDIIYFYNNIYVREMTPYVSNFSASKKSEKDLIQLSPHPTEVQNLPKQPSMNHKLYVCTMEKNEVRYSENKLSYEIGRSPRKELEKLNDFTKNCNLGKRDCLTTNESIEHKVRKVMRDRGEKRDQEDRNFNRT